MHVWLQAGCAALCGCLARASRLSWHLLLLRSPPLVSVRQHKVVRIVMVRTSNGRTNRGANRCGIHTERGKGIIRNVRVQGIDFMQGDGRWSGWLVPGWTVVMLAGAARRAAVNVTTSRWDTH